MNISLVLYAKGSQCMGLEAQGNGVTTVNAGFFFYVFKNESCAPPQEKDYSRETSVLSNFIQLNVT